MPASGTWTMFDSLNSSTLRIRRSHHSFHTTKPIKAGEGWGWEGQDR